MLTTSHSDICLRPLTATFANSNLTSRRAATAAVQVTPDRELIRAIARGDRQAMRTLYVRHKFSLYRFTLRITRNPSVAEDILSDTFLDVWRCAGAFKANAEVSTWLFAIARHKALRSFRRACDPLDEHWADAIEDPGDRPDIALSSKDRSATIQRCLMQLSAIHREVLDLVYYHGKTAEEVAYIVHVPVGTVKTRMHYARQRMKALLQAHDAESV